MAIVQELPRNMSSSDEESMASLRRASFRRVEKLVAEAQSDEFRAARRAGDNKNDAAGGEAKKDKNLSMEIKNYQRKTMLNGIDQIELLDDVYELVKQAEAQGVNPNIVSNFKGKEILDSLHDLKKEYDKEYFQR